MIFLVVFVASAGGGNERQELGWRGRKCIYAAQHCQQTMVLSKTATMTLFHALYMTPVRMEECVCVRVYLCELVYVCVQFPCEHCACVCVVCARASAKQFF